MVPRKVTMTKRMVCSIEGYVVFGFAVIHGARVSCVGKLLQSISFSVRGFGNRRCTIPRDRKPLLCVTRLQVVSFDSITGDHY